MARRFATNVDLQKNQMLNMVVQVLTAAPAAPVAGQVYYDSTLNQFGYYNGTAWVYNASAPNATATATGLIQLAGDITGGSATSPVVSNLHLTADTAINHKLTAVTDPTGPQDAATKNYVDGKVNGVAWKQPVAAATAAALPANTQSGSGATGTLTATANAALSVDGYAVAVGDRVLVKNEATAKNNGIYTVSATGSGTTAFVLVRAADATTTAQLQDATMLVMQGTANADTIWNLSNAPGFVVDTTALTWVNIQSATAVTADGVYITRVGNQIAALGSSATPATPANGAITNPTSASSGAGRKVTGALAHDGTTTAFTITHGLNTSALMVVGQLNNAGVPGAPIDLDWAPGTVNTVVITYPAALAAGTVHYISVIG